MCLRLGWRTISRPLRTCILCRADPRRRPRALRPPSLCQRRQKTAGQDDSGEHPGETPQRRTGPSDRDVIVTAHEMRSGG